MATTKNGIVYPDDYNSIADIPEDMKKNAESIDECVEELKRVDANNTTSIEKLQEENIDQDKNIESNSKSIEEIKQESNEIKAENERLKNDVDNIALVGEASGENIDLDDSSEARFLEFGIGGNHKQETREGYNLYNYKDVEAGKKLDGETGKIVSDPTFCFAGYIKVDENTEYVRSDVGTSTNAMLDENKQIIEKKLGTSFTTPAGCKYVGFNIRKEKYADGSYLKFVMNKGTELKPFEEFGASPSIDYPSEIKTVGNNVQLFDESKVSTLINNGMTLSYSNERGLMFDGTTTSQTNFWINDLEINLKEFDYTLSSNLSLKNKGFYALKDSTGNDLVKNSLDEAVTFKSSETTATQLLIQIDKGVTFDNQSLKIKFEKGTVATPYSPYNQGSVEVNVANKNLLNLVDIEETEKSGVTYSIKNGILTLNGTATAGIQLAFLRNIHIKKGKYTHSVNYIKNGLFFSFDNLAYTMLNGYIGNKTITFELTEDKNFSTYFLFITMGTVLDNVKLEPQLEEGTTATDFVPHQEQSYIMPVQQEILEGDYFDFENEKEVHTWKKLILTGNEEWTRRLFSKYVFALQESLSNCTSPIWNNTKLQICNCFKVGEAGYVKGNNVFSINNLSTLLIQDDDITTIEEFKALLKSKYDAESPVVVFYKALVPIELDFTSKQKTIAKQIKQTLHTYKNVTHISSNDEVSPIFNVKYAKDPNLKNENLQKQIDEIKQLLSTTQTSALLLDNLQKDVESEVE